MTLLVEAPVMADVTDPTNKGLPGAPGRNLRRMLDSGGREWKRPPDGQVTSVGHAAPAGNLSPLLQTLTRIDEHGRAHAARLRHELLCIPPA